MHCRADIIDDGVIIILHSAADPVEHHADKAVFIKFSYELLLLLRHAQSCSFFLDDPHDKIIDETEEIIFNLFATQSPVDVQDEWLVLQHGFKDLQQSLLPCIVSLFPGKRAGGIFKAAPFHEIINVFKMIVKCHPADPAVIGQVSDGDFVNWFFQKKFF